ncbi:MAG: hypothetical protein ACJATT_003524 [Myxococcota bacterium]|jgi:hypothetical protein
MVETPLAAGPTLPFGNGRMLQFLGLEQQADGGGSYEVSVRPATETPWQKAVLTYQSGSAWALRTDAGAHLETLELGSPDDVFTLAMGQPTLPTQAVARATPHWPAAVQDSLARRRASGAYTIAFDAKWFLARLTGSAIDQPLLFPHAVSKLGLRGLAVVSEVLATIAGTTAKDKNLIALLQRGLQTADATGTPYAWTGDGRLIGESTWGDLSQVGTDIADGCQAAVGTGQFTVTFDPDEPMGLGFAPEVPSADVANDRQSAHDASVGTGIEVGMVEQGEAAAAAGVEVGMVATQLSSPELVLHSAGVALPFEGILGAIDARRNADEWLTMTFTTASPHRHWYAVEMPAAATLQGLGVPAKDTAVGADFDSLCGPTLLWREPIPRLFLGESGSVTCAHVDICPQVQVAYGLLGSKVLGVASHSATPRLRARYSGEDDEEPATYIPTDRPLSVRQAHLLQDIDVSLVLLRPGDIAVIHSGALHFASNGADELGGSVYHGVMTQAALPRLRTAAAEPGGSSPDGDDAFADHLFASDLLRLVEKRLRHGA